MKWYRVRKEQTNLESKEKTVKKGDLSASSAHKKYDNFNNGPEPLTVIPTDARFYGEFQSRIDDKAIISKLENKNIYEVTLSNQGGLVMPVIIEWTYKDGSIETERLPAEIWRTNEKTVTKVFVKEKEVSAVVLDPQKETADINTSDNVFPKIEEITKFDELKKKN